LYHHHHQFGSGGGFSTLFNQSLLASGGRPAPAAMVPQNDAINMSIQSQAALLNQSNLALQMEITK
jgi:hypothetical protein